MSHSSLVFALKKPGLDIHQSLTPKKCDAIHMVMGIVGEVGELLDAIKKATIYEQDLDRENVIEELGDIEFYLEGLRQNLNITRERCLDANYVKLRKRYGLTFTNEAAKVRADKQS